jgi:membrane-bound lytic murein transglycosylase D
MRKHLFIKLLSTMAFFLTVLPAYTASSTPAEKELFALQNGLVSGDSANEMFPLSTIPLNQPLPTPSAQLSEEKWSELKNKILNDFSNRLSDGFKISEGLRERASFWFDIYTRYGEAHHVVHHVRFPWIVFEIVDTTDLILQGKGPLWLRRERGQKFADKRVKEIRSALKSLSKRKDYESLPRLEQKLFKTLASVPGPRKQVIRFALENIRSQLGQRDFYQRGLVNSSKYLTYMEEEFHKAGLPTELTRMPFVESSFNEMAYSKVGASGIWQIMPTTGKSYMIVNDVIDERNSPLKATAAAARLLKFYNRTLGSWPLAITAYNNGIGNIQKAIKKSKSRELDEIIHRYHQGDFRFASSNFYTCFLAALYAEKYHELLFKNVNRAPLQEREEIRLATRTRARNLHKITGLNKEELLRYNLDLRSALKAGATLPSGYRLHIPPNRRVGRGDKKSQPKT